MADSLTHIFATPNKANKGQIHGAEPSTESQNSIINMNHSEKKIRSTPCINGSN